MRIGLLTGARGAAIELHSLIQEVVQAEEDGFDSIWIPQVSSGRVLMPSPCYLWRRPRPDASQWGPQLCRYFPSTLWFWLNMR